MGGLQAWVRTGSEGEEDDSVVAGAPGRREEHSPKMSGPGPEQSRSVEGRNQEFGLGPRKVENRIQLVGFVSLELREEVGVRDRAETPSVSVVFKAPDG